MHFIRLKFFITSLALFISFFALPSSVDAQTIITDAELSQAERSPRIESDTERNAFIFIIDGEEVALLDKSGFYIRNSIVYGGTLTDAGSDWVDNYISDSANTSDLERGVQTDAP